MGFRGHGGGESADQLRVPRGQRAHPPGIVIAGGEPRQQQASREEVQGQLAGGAPEAGRAMPLVQCTRAHEQRQGVMHG